MVYKQLLRSYESNQHLDCNIIYNYLRFGWERNDEKERMVYLPEDLVIDIVRRVGKEGFRELAPFIVAGPVFRNAALSTEVLEEVDLDEFIFVSSLANEGSMYRPFLMRCLEAGNVTAKYVEGIRMAVKEGPSTRSLELIKCGEEDIPYARFAFAIFAICSGKYEEGMDCMATLVAQVSWLDALVEIGEMVMAQVADIEPPMTGNYNTTYRYPPGDIPNCVHFACTMHDVCFECIAYWYARRIMVVC